MSKTFSIALLCGGPSPERGISLNSARSVCDHLSSEKLKIEPIYFDFKKRPYRIARAQLYSNTPSDFDFKLQSSGKQLSPAALKELLRGCDLAFPAMHGPFGEDGEVQKILEDAGVPYIGSGSSSCRRAFHKYHSTIALADAGFNSLPSLLIKKEERNLVRKIGAFFAKHEMSRAVVKPAEGGSSIGVFSVTSPQQAAEKAREIWKLRVYDELVVEPFCRGTEFTVIILQNCFGLPVAILPTEIELDYRDDQIFDYRKKYLATRQVTYHCPPRFDDRTIERIQIQAEQIFTHFGMRDFARFDGWVLQDGSVVFTDLNPISGMEQNSFLFMQSARIGMSHRDVLRYVVTSACRRHGLALPPEEEEEVRNRVPVNVLFGGDSAERQVSLMSGTNVWLKLRRSKKYAPQPFLLDTHGDVYRLPYAYALNHTVEEVMFMCQGAARDEERLLKLRTAVSDKLHLKREQAHEPLFIPEKMSLQQFIQRSPRVFIALHGGIGENGTLQALLEKSRKPFNGPGSRSSRICMDKFVTGELVASLASHGVYTAARRKAELAAFKGFTPARFAIYWKKLTGELASPAVIVKPIDDGCSAGIAKLTCAEDLRVYVQHSVQQLPYIPPGALSGQTRIIEMPSQRMHNIIFEAFIETDKVNVVNNTLHWHERTGWIEVTVGVLERAGKVRALSPSITVASGDVLTLEEKFQGGTGVNITPPPAEYVSAAVVQKIRARIELVARKLGIQGYSRIDTFVDRKSGELMVIEANTLPGLTPSTVIYHQALAEEPPLFPMQLLEKIMDHAVSRYGRRLPRR